MVAKLHHARLDTYLVTRLIPCDYVKKTKIVEKSVEENEWHHKNTVGPRYVQVQLSNEKNTKFHN